MPDQRPLKLLFIKLKHIGDALILTPTLRAVRDHYPQSRIWVVTRKGCESILQGCTAWNELRTTAAAPEAGKRLKMGWVKDALLLKELRRQRFDHAFELSDGDRGRWLAALSGSRHATMNTTYYPLKGIWKRVMDRPSHTSWAGRHRVEKDFLTVRDALDLPESPPAMEFQPSRMQPTPELESLKDPVILHPGTRWIRKTWPRERWIQLGRRILDAGIPVVISAGPDPQEIELADAMLETWGRPAHARSTLGRCSWAQLAGLLSRARLFIGVDTAAMHLAAACGTPSVALFGPSIVSQWSPWKVDATLFTPSQFRTETELKSIPEHEWIQLIETDAVWKEAARRLGLKAG